MELIDIKVDSEMRPYFSPQTTGQICSCSPVIDSPYLGWDPDSYERFGTGSEFLAATRKEQEGFADVLD